jgi:xanthine/CO dehydrogenase XdhC/CoxF family maturation factor
VRVPAGLDIGAETPEEIALSIMAEIVSRRTENGVNNHGRNGEGFTLRGKFGRFVI